MKKRLPKKTGEKKAQDRLRLNLVQTGIKAGATQMRTLKMD